MNDDASPSPRGRRSPRSTREKVDRRSPRVGPILSLLLLAAALCLVASPALAAGSGSTSRAAQYVFVVDDSGSMSKEVRGQPAADPNRLAVFGVRSILSMLDDRDEATVVRLNGPAQGQKPPPIRPLKENRSKLRKLTALDSKLAAYGGAETPCKRALGTVKERLRQAHRPGVAQVVMFLTDGACTGPAPDPKAFLEGLPSAEEGLFKFYLLRFSGRNYTESLATLADRTGGTSIEVSAGEPTSILDSFASALSRSQGYRSYVLTPSDAKLASHGAARRVRLLAVAPGSGPELSLSVEGRSPGAGPKPLEASRRTGTHQYEDGRTYRYAALDYQPGEVPVSVDVEGAGSNWKVVAVPEYRLFTELSIRKGECGTGGVSVGAVEVGSSVCAEVRLVNAGGDPVGSDVVGGGTEAVVRYRGPDDSEARELPAQQVGDRAVYRLERVNLSKGNHIFDPVVRLAVPGGEGRTVDIEGGAQTLQASSLAVSATPSELNAGDLKPGGKSFHELKIAGNFPPTQARLSVKNRDEIPDCVSFSLSDVPEGKTQELTPGQTYTLGVDVAPYCGPSTFDRQFEAVLRVEFADSATRSVPTLVVPTSLHLTNQMSVPEAVEISATGGGTGTARVELSGNFTREMAFTAMVPPTAERAKWPDRGLLELAFLDDEGAAVKSGQRPAREHGVTVPAGGGEAVALRAAPDVCCGGGTWKTELALVPDSGTPSPIRIPVRVDVESAGVAACWGSTALLILALVLLVLAALYGYGMYRSTHRIDPERMAAKVKPLVYDDYGRPSPADERRKGRARDIVEEQFAENRWERWTAWFQANPLKFGLPGEDYYECVEFSVDSRRPEVWIDDIKGTRNFRSEVDADAGRYTKLMFVQAQPGLEFFAVPDERQRVAGLKLERSFGGGPGGDEPQLVKLRGDRLLRETDGDGGDLAGWEIG
ncbi:MAG: hypothetical protein ABEL76_12950 [Bradymonadaceae bacterium]